jgi:class 3 adenylate cyclase
MPPVRRLTAILAADVAGYSRLMGADEEGTHERLKAHLGELIEPKIAEHRGRVVKNTGDGLLAEFSSVVDAVRCAAEVQRAMADRNAETSEDKRITFRVGINLGDVIAEPDDIYGDGVNVAARLEALAEPGGICVSRVVRDQIRDKLPYPFEDKGEQSVKNIARSVRVFALRPETIAELPAASTPAIPRRRRAAPRAVAAAVAGALVLAVVAWWGWSGTRSSPSAPPTSESGCPDHLGLTQPPRLRSRRPFVEGRISFVRPFHGSSRTRLLAVPLRREQFRNAPEVSRRADRASLQPPSNHRPSIDPRCPLPFRRIVFSFL